MSFITIICCYTGFLFREADACLPLLGVVVYQCEQCGWCCGSKSHPCCCITLWLQGNRKIDKLASTLPIYNTPFFSTFGTQVLLCTYLYAMPRYITKTMYLEYQNNLGSTLECLGYFYFCLLLFLISNF